MYCSSSRVIRWRRLVQPEQSLDQFMRAMWRAYGKPGGSREGYVDRPYTMEDAEMTLAEVAVIYVPGVARLLRVQPSAVVPEASG